MKKKKVFGVAVCVLIALGVIGNLTDNSNSGNPSSTTKQEQKESKEMQMYQKFVSIPMGSDYETVKSLLGDAGKLQHENEIGGVKTQSYQFNIGNTHAIMMFQNGALTSKAMDSLAFYKQNGDKITLNQFNQIQTGMTYDQVKQIFNHDGLLKSETDIMGSVSKLYAWMNSDGSNVIVTFTGDTVDSKTQTNLK